jgi:hypothetical protein
VHSPRRMAVLGAAHGNPLRHGGQPEAVPCSQRADDAWAEMLPRWLPSACQVA